ncbi:HAD-IA family hydrolase [Streptomyces sp. A1-5]|uniref:HAD-IA family hydrolase n=1 Tax=Streptomyces sp. A1-5 TaxID=2738410 RepID=UPI001F2F65E8|nr:HAD-IA family hydrolase [Streptomyces sp. A1-5]UJB44886.1 HAD-IA family hydrolase [Streptomyces sp. A1-5]
MARGTDGCTPYRGLILDFVGVLTEGVQAALHSWCASEGLAPDAWRITLADLPEGRELYAALESGRLSQAEWNRRTAPLLGVEDHHDLMGRAWSGVRPAVNMIALARAARRAGYTVALLSNSFGLDPYDPYEALGVWKLFDVTVISEREGIAKPDPEIYQRTLERMDLPGEACVFVDDNPGNLPPAAALGITTVHADGQADTVKRLSSLLGILPAAGRVHR